MKKILILSLLIIFLLCSGGLAAEEEILIIFDASLSMAEDISGGIKYNLAASAAKKKLRELGNSKKIGLRTIGITLDGNMFNYISDPSSMCRATKLAVPIGINNVEYISNIIDTGTPLGVTPLLFSLKQAIENDFSHSSYKHIILITDGGESCDGDPCGYVSKITKTRSDIKIDIIAIGVDNSDFGQLECITKAANGKIFNVRNKSEMSRAFDEILPVKSPDTVPEQSSEQTEITSNDEKNSSYTLPPIQTFGPTVTESEQNFGTKKEYPAPIMKKSGIIYKNYLIEVND